MIKIISILGFVLYSLINSVVIAGSKELKVTLQSSYINLDPGGVQDSQSLFVSNQISCQLIRNKGSSFVLDAAESIKYITPLIISIKLNRNAKFNDGTPVRARDVFTSLEYIKESRSIFRNIFTWIKSVNVVDESTVQITLDKHIPQFLKTLSATNLTIFKEEFLLQVKKDKSLWKKPIGCGPYKVVSFGENKIKLEPTTNGLPIEFTLIKGNEIGSAEAKKYDIVTIRVSDNKELSEFNIVEMFDPIQYYIGINPESHLWKNKEERCKFLADLDVSDVISSYDGFVIEANDLLPKGTLGYDRKCNYLQKIKKISQFNPVSKLKNKSICFSYLTVSMQEKNRNTYVKMLQKSYKNVNIKPIYNVKSFGSKFIKSHCDILILGLTSTYLDGYEFLTVFENNDANFTGFTQLSDRILKSQRIENAIYRAKEYQNISHEITNSCVVRPIFTMPNRRIYIRKGLITPGIGLVSVYQYDLAKVSI